MTIENHKVLVPCVSSEVFLIDALAFHASVFIVIFYPEFFTDMHFCSTRLGFICAL